MSRGSSARSIAIASSLLGMMYLSGSANAAPVADSSFGGSLKWQDGDAKKHAARGDRYEVYSDSLAGPILRASGNLDDNGAFTITLATDQFMPSAYIKYYAQNSGGYVASDFAITQAQIYTSTTSDVALAPGGLVVIDSVLGNTTDEDNSFAVADGILTGQRFLGAVRPGGALASLPARFPQISTDPLTDPPTSYYSGNKIRILDKDRWDFDVIGHEFSHYAHDMDRLTNSPGGNHMLGVSNIPGRGKGPGVRLAWGEGIGNFMGVLSSKIDTTGPTTLANYGDTRYTDTLDSTNDYDLEGTAGSGNAGEGDEVSVSRILWDITDNDATEAFDRISRGGPQVYKDLIAARNRISGVATTRLGSLNQVNDYYMNVVATNDIDRKNYGAIYEANGVSPHVVGTLNQGIRDPDTDAITVDWQRQNNNANDQFQIIVWNQDFTDRLIDTFLVPGDVTSYTLTAAQAALLKSQGGGTWLNYAVIGSDLKTPGGAAYAAADQTGNYWSDAYTFYLIPEPATAMGALSVLSLAIVRKRR